MMLVVMCDGLVKELSRSCDFLKAEWRNGCAVKFMRNSTDKWGGLLSLCYFLRGNS